jgi:hypothetical protein
MIVTRDHVLRAQIKEWKDLRTLVLPKKCCVAGSHIVGQQWDGRTDEGKGNGFRKSHIRQKVNFNATCISRGGAARTTCPNKAVSMPPSTATGPKNWV